MVEHTVLGIVVLTDSGMVLHVVNVVYCIKVRCIGTEVLLLQKITTLGLIESKIMSLKWFLDLLTQRTIL